MKNLLVALLVSMLSTTSAFAQQSSLKGEPFVLVELFASEGCSSCPPADNLLRQMTAYARSSGKRIYTLSFQVDYWNYLGWTDPFSSPAFSARQQQYAAILPGGVYTPEMIINGQEAFIGSDTDKANEFAAKYLSIPAANSISLNLVSQNNAIKIDYALGQADNNAVINFALVERGLVSQVTAGENAGRILYHDNIVRNFKTIDLDNIKGSVVFVKPQGKDLTKFTVIAYEQSKLDRSILAASSIDIAS